METKGLIHVSAPDHPEAGRRNLPLERGPIAMRGVRDPMRGPGPRGGLDSLGGPEPWLLALERLFFLGHVAFPDLPRPRNRSGPLSGGQDFGLQGSGCLVVVKDDY
jgi:hypothetical protein